LKHWGYYLNEEQFDTLFKKLDYDKDGKVSYEDFQNSVGNEISPPEFLYFRQDLRPQKPIRWSYRKWWETTIGLGSFWALHTRIIYNKAYSWMAMLPPRLKDNWTKFNSRVEALYINNEDKEVHVDDFQKLWDEFGIPISEVDKNILLEAFPGMIDGNFKCIDMTHLFEIQKASEINRLYEKVDLSDDDEEMGDFSGYTGVIQRNSKYFETFSYEKLINLFVDDDKLPFILRSIKDIDQDNNGYVTTTELEDIIKLHYPILKDKNLKKLFKPFASIQNRILIDYKSFRKDLIDKIKEKLEDKKSSNENHLLKRSLTQNLKTRAFNKKKLNSLTEGNLNKLDIQSPRTLK